jgi:hypothetical protein
MLKSNLAQIRSILIRTTQTAMEFRYNAIWAGLSGLLVAPT